MSLKSLALGAQYNCDEDTANDRFAAAQAVKRNTVLPEADIVAQATELYPRVTGAVWKEANRAQLGWS